MKEIFSNLVEETKKVLRGDAIRNWLIKRAEKIAVKYLRKLAKQTDNKVDDRLVKALVASIQNKEYMHFFRDNKKTSGNSKK